MKRPRTNMSGLVMHTTPNGKCHSSKQNRCEQEIRKCNAGIKEFHRLLDENWKITHVEKKEPKKLVIALEGWPALGQITVTLNSYKQNYEGKVKVKIIREIP